VAQRSVETMTVGARIVCCTQPRNERRETRKEGSAPWRLPRVCTENSSRLGWRRNPGMSRACGDRDHLIVEPALAHWADAWHASGVFAEATSYRLVLGREGAWRANGRRT
jgi:hypothetical protein